MISSIFFISFIFLSVTVVSIIDKSKIKSEYKEYFEGLAFGLLSILALYIHYYFVEPSAIFPHINKFIGHAYLISLSFFLFGVRAGLITFSIQSTARIFLTQEFLFYSLSLYILLAFIGNYFHKSLVESSDRINFKIISRYLVFQTFITLIVFFVGPFPKFSDNLFPILIFLIGILNSIILIIVTTILRNRLQLKLLSNLRYEKALLSNVFYNLSEAIIVVDRQLNILRINNLAENLTGFNSSEVLGKKISNVRLIKDKQLADTINEQIRNIRENETIRYQDITVLSKNGEEIPIECKISGVIESESNQFVIVILFIDLREIKNSIRKIEESEKRFQQFFNFSLEGIWRYELREPIDINLPSEEQIKIFFEKGYLAECNDVFARMYGFNSREELIGTPLSATLVEEDENNITYLRAFIENNYRLINAESVEKDKAGNTKYFLNSLYGIIENNKILGAWGLQIDVTEERLMSRQIRDNNKLLLSILNSPKGIVIFSLDKNYCYTAFSISHKEIMKKIWGVDIQIGLNMLDAIKSESDREKAKANFDRALKGEYFNVVEEYGDEELHRQFWFDNYSSIYDQNEIIGVAVFVTDISQQKEFEMEIERKNLLLNTLVNNIPDSIYVKDKNLRRVIVNKTHLKWSGFNDENDVIGKRDDELFPEDLAKLYIEDDKKVLEGTPVINREEEIVSTDNQVIYTLSSKVPMYDNNGEVIGLIGICRDITKTKEYLNLLKEEEEKLRILFNQSFQFIGLLNPSGVIIEANHTACDFIGIDVNDVKNLPFYDTPWWKHSAIQQERLKKAIESASEGNFVRMETTHLNKDNQLRIIDFSLTPIKNLSGKIVYLIAEGRDITDIKVLQNKLSESEERYRMLVETSMDAITIINSNGDILFSNKRHKELFKTIKDDDIKRNIFNLIHQDEKEKLNSNLKIALLNQTPILITLKFLKNDSEIFWGELNLKSFVDGENSDLFLCVLRDITYKKQIEDELKKRVYELEKYNQLMVGRELKMVELKKEVNSLCKQFGLPTRYSEDDI